MGDFGPSFNARSQARSPPIGLHSTWRSQSSNTTNFITILQVQVEVCLLCAYGFRAIPISPCVVEEYTGTEFHS